MKLIELQTAFSEIKAAPLMQIRCLHNAPFLEDDQGVMGLRCPFVVWQSFSVFLLKAEHFDILTGWAEKNISKAIECTYFLDVIYTKHNQVLQFNKETLTRQAESRTLVLI